MTTSYIIPTDITTGTTVEQLLAVAHHLRNACDVIISEIQEKTNNTPNDEEIVRIQYWQDIQKQANIVIAKALPIEEIDRRITEGLCPDCGSELREASGENAVADPSDNYGVSYQKSTWRECVKCDYSEEL